MKLICLMTSALFLLATQAYAGTFEDAFVAKYPSAAGAKFQSAFPGFWAVIKGNEILYVKDDLSIQNAQVIDLKTKVSAEQIEANLASLKDAK